MATVSEVTIKYAARGAKQARKADERVRDTIQETADTARSETGTINRWMQRNRAALIGIGAAAAGAMAAVISSSPALQAELAGVRLGFSLLAMQIGEDLAPAFEGIGEAVLDLSEAYSELPDPVRKVISGFVGLTLVGGVLLGVLGAIGPPLARGAGYAAQFARWLGALVSGSTAAAAAVGTLLGVIGVWVLEVTGVLDAVQNLGAWIRDLLPDWVADGITAVIGLFSGPLAAIGGFVIGFIEGGFDKGFERAKQVIMTFVNAAKRFLQPIVDFINTIWDTLTDIGGSVWDATLNILGGALDVVEDVLGTLEKIVSKTWDGLVNIVMELTDPVTGGAGSAERSAAAFLDPRQGWQFTGFQSGGIVTGPTTALIGEGREDEAVLPLSRLDSMLTDGTGGGGTNVVFQSGAIQIEGVRNPEEAGRQVRDAATEIGAEFDSRSNI